MNKAIPDSSNVCAVIVTHHPDACFASRLEKIALEVDRVIIVDNHSSSLELESLQKLLVDGQIDLIVNGENVGVGTALNQGVEYALAHRYVWGLLFDQDSDISVGMLASFADVCIQHPVLNCLSVIGSNYHDRDSGLSGVTELQRNSTATWIRQKSVITSGSLISLAVWQKIGPFREDFFIDGIDHEYCLRSRASGYDVVLATKCILAHKIGDNRRVSFLWMSLESSCHSATRRYYMYRNLVVITKMYWKDDLSWVVGQNFTALKNFIKIIVFEKNRSSKIYNIFVGLVHGVRNQLGARKAI